MIFSSYLEPSYTAGCAGGSISKVFLSSVKKEALSTGTSGTDDDGRVGLVAVKMPARSIILEPTAIAELFESTGNFPLASHDNMDLPVKGMRPISFLILLTINVVTISVSFIYAYIFHLDISYSAIIETAKSATESHRNSG